MSEMDIPFNKPYISCKEMNYISDAILSGNISGNGRYTKNCHKYFEKRWGFKKVLLTTSCTDALEMCALLLNIEQGDEVIIPSYTFVSTALAFVREGAMIKFVDSRIDHPGMDENKVEELITENTKAIVVVHYAGVACDMDKIMSIADKYGLFVVEDAAHAIDSYYKDQPLGGIGHFGCFSFHETKNIQCGEGGMLVINDERFLKRSEIIWEKGTNRTEFYRGEVNKYGWVDKGSSFLPSEITAAYLFAQLEEIELIQKQRLNIWNYYKTGLSNLERKGLLKLPFIPAYATNNAHMFYLICKNDIERDGLIKHLKENNILSVFHYLCLHKSKYYLNNFSKSPKLQNAESYEEQIIRLPLYAGMNVEDLYIVKKNVVEYFS